MEQLSKKEISKKLYNYISNEFLILFFSLFIFIYVDLIIELVFLDYINIYLPFFFIILLLKIF